MSLYQFTVFVLALVLSSVGKAESLMQQSLQQQQFLQNMQTINMINEMNGEKSPPPVTPGGAICARRVITIAAGVPTALVGTLLTMGAAVTRIEPRECAFNAMKLAPKQRSAEQSAELAKWRRETRLLGAKGLGLLTALAAMVIVDRNHNCGKLSYAEFKSLPIYETMRKKLSEEQMIQFYNDSVQGMSTEKIVAKYATKENADEATKQMILALNEATNKKSKN